MEKNLLVSLPIIEFILSNSLKMRFLIVQRIDSSRSEIAITAFTVSSYIQSQFQAVVQAY